MHARVRNMGWLVVAAPAGAASWIHGRIMQAMGLPAQSPHRRGRSPAGAQRHPWCRAAIKACARPGGSGRSRLVL